MATFNSVFVFSPGTGNVAGPNVTVETVGATSSGTEHSIGSHNLVILTADGNCFFRLGPSGVADAVSTDIPLWATTYVQVDMSNQFNSIKFYNPGAGNIHCYIIPIEKF